MSGTTPQVPGTYVFDAAEGRRGRALNRLCGSLKNVANHAKFSADEAAYWRRVRTDGTAAGRRPATGLEPG